MARHVVLGNGSLTVGLDGFGLVHDFYFPYVGQDNLTNARSAHHKIGVWVDGTFSWVDDGSWDVSVDFRDDALIAHCAFTNHALGIHIQTEDFVHPFVNAFCRRIAVTSLFDGNRDVRIFMHQVFEISRSGRADTAMFVPEEHYIFDYKGKVCLVAGGINEHNKPFDQYAVGNYGIEGKEGTFRDAEDGKLSGSPIEHGGVDSVLRFSRQLSEGQSLYFDYWVTAGESQKQAADIHATFSTDGLQSHRDMTLTHWQKWLRTAEESLQHLSPAEKTAAKKSLLVIKAHIDNHGGVIASIDSSIYNYGRDYYSYVWPRDGAFAVWPLIRLGYNDEAKKFFTFCQNIMTSDGYMMHKYQPDGAVGSTWHPLIHEHHNELAIQEDETAIVLFMLYEYFKASQDVSFIQARYTDFVVPAANFLSSFIDEATGLPHASYDLWEEKFLTSTYTVAITYKALLAACEIAQKLDEDAYTKNWLSAAQKLRKGFSSLFNSSTESYRKGLLLQSNSTLGFDDTLDISSLYGMVMFANEEETIEWSAMTMKAIKERLLDKSPSKGLPRYEHDRYFASDPPYFGNPWFVCTLWYAQLLLMSNERTQAKKLVDWTLTHTLPSGVLSEQIDPTSGKPKSVTPLVWSHAELINTLLDLK
jgi:GH15 family glucan-1,4-alpha-glucosidase